MVSQSVVPFHSVVPPYLLDAIAERVAERFPKALTDDAVRAADVVISMGCGDVCPIIPGIRYDDWAVGDPALASREGAEANRDDIEGRVRALVNELTH